MFPILFSPQVMFVFVVCQSCVMFATSVQVVLCFVSPDFVMFVSSGCVCNCLKSSASYVCNFVSPSCVIYDILVILIVLCFQFL